MHRRLPRLWLLFLGLGLLGALLLVRLRMVGVRAAFGDYMGCTNCLDHAVLLSDLRPLALLVVLLAAAWLSRRRWWRLPLMLAAVTIVTLYAIDQGIFLIFGFRLKVSDLFRYGGDTSAAWSVVMPVAMTPRGVLLLAGWALGCLGWCGAIVRAGRAIGMAAAGTAAAAVMAGGAQLVVLPGYVMPESYHDFISINLPTGVDRAFSPALREALQKRPKPPTTCAAPAVTATGQVPRRSVILLVVESLSSYHSALLSGIGHSTPELDRLAQAHSYFPDFHANGFTTDGGLIALLTGRVPLPAAGRYQSSHAYAGYETPLEPHAFAQLAQAGYQTGFFTTGQLSFLNKGDWVKALGIQHVEGAEHPFYAQLPRGAFSAAGDQALYDRYLDWYDHERQTTRPLFSTLLTVSTHPPFHVPGTNIADEAQAILWTDAQVGRFVRALEARGYFENGILVVTGDHRAMTVVRPAEQQRFGRGAITRVPGVVIGPSGLPRGPVAGHWQQADFLAGLLDMAGLRSCTMAFAGRLLGHRYAPAHYILHAQGAMRDHILVWDQTTPDPYQVVMDGDDTRWLDPAPSGPDAAMVIDHISRERANLPRVPNDLLELLLQARQPRR